MDSADKEKTEFATAELSKLMAMPSVEGIPLLLLGNKNDLEGCYDEKQLIELFKLKEIKNRKVGCFSISAKNKNNLGTALEWLSNLNRIN